MGHLRGGCQCARCGLVCREGQVVGGVKWQRSGPRRRRRRRRRRRQRRRRRRGGYYHQVAVSWAESWCGEGRAWQSAQWNVWARLGVGPWRHGRGFQATPRGAGGDMAEVCSKRAMTSEGRTKREWIGRMKGGSQEAQVGFDGLAAIRPGNNELGGPGWPRRSSCVLAATGLEWAWSRRIAGRPWWRGGGGRVELGIYTHGSSERRCRQQTDRQQQAQQACLCLEAAQRARRAPTACQMIK
jgi:hypothetical protein